MAFAAVSGIHSRFSKLELSLLFLVSLFVGGLAGVDFLTAAVDFFAVEAVAVLDKDAVVNFLSPEPNVFF